MLSYEPWPRVERSCTGIRTKELPLGRCRSVSASACPLMKNGFRVDCTMTTFCLDLGVSGRPGPLPLRAMRPRFD